MRTRTRTHIFKQVGFFAHTCALTLAIHFFAPAQFANTKAVQDVIQTLGTEIVPLSVLMGGKQTLADLPKLLDVIVAAYGGAPSMVCLLL